MKITVDWDTEEKQAILITYERAWTWDDFDAAVKQMLELLDSTDYKVNLIFDIRNGGFPPMGASTRFREVAETNHPHAGQIVFVAPTMLAQFTKGILQILNNVYWGTFKPPSFQFVASLEEARQVLSQHTTQAAETGEEKVEA